jgi:hypothetical protein
MQSAVPELQKPTDQGDDDGQGASPAPAAQRDRQADRSEDVDDDGTLPDEITPEEMAKYAQSAKRRIRKLWHQRRALRMEVQRLKTLEPQAQAADSVSTFLRENDISREDFLHGLNVMREIRRGNFAAARAGLEPYWNLIEQYMGNQLPPDLQEAVRQGQMTTQAAVAFSKERMDRAMLENRHQRTQQVAANQQQYYQQQQEAARVHALADAIANEVNTWERTVWQHDPNYAAKADAVRHTMLAVIAEQGKPQSVAHGIAIAREAYRRVNEWKTSWAPPKRPTSRGPSSTGRTSGAAPEAKSIHEIVQRARETFAHAS